MNMNMNKKSRAWSWAEERLWHRGLRPLERTSACWLVHWPSRAKAQKSWGQTLQGK